MLRRIITADGSTTLLHETLGETYHSVKGALAESLHVYIRAGLEFVQEQTPDAPVHILEVGYGTGLNALLTLSHAAQTVFYTGIEPFPIQDEELNTCRELNDPNFSMQHGTAARLPWRRPESLGDFHPVSNRFYLRKLHCSLETCNITEPVSLVYFYAFAPKYQPELWLEEAWKHLETLLQPNAVMVTYCAQGAFRRMLQQRNWVVERLPGPPAQKKEMIRGRFAKL